MKSLTVLVIDDDERILRFAQSALKLSGYRHLSAMNGRDGLEMARTRELGLIVLDIGLPVMDGWEVLRQLRTFSNVPVIILSAKGEDLDKIKGLSLGADDYLAKPFNPDELVARINAVVRRSQGESAKARVGVVKYDNMIIDLKEHRIASGNMESKLTRLEGLLLAYLITNAGRLLTSEDILSKVWGPAYRDDDPLLRTTIYRVRAKVKAVRGTDDLITNVPRVGYIFKKPSAKQEAACPVREP